MAVNRPKKDAGPVGLVVDRLEHCSSDSITSTQPLSRSRDGSRMFPIGILDSFLIRIHIYLFSVLRGFSGYIKKGIVPIERSILREVNCVDCIGNCIGVLGLVCLRKLYG